MLTFLLAGSGCELDTVALGAVLSRQRRCSVDRWHSPGIRYGAGIVPTMGNDECCIAGHRNTLISGPITLPALELVDINACKNDI